MYKSVIAAYSRSPFTMARKGALIDTKPVNLLADVIKNLVSKSNVKKEDIEDIVVGCAFQVGEQCFNIGKLVTFLTNMEVKTSGMTVDRWCGSSMEAIHIAAGKIAMGSGKVFICGGVESMTRVNTGFDPIPYPENEKDNPNVYFSMGITAENVAKKYGISRKEQQDFAISSHQKAHEAQTKGKFKNENVAAATLICEENYAKENNLEILGRIVSTAVEGCEPNYMGLGPIGASKKALQRAGLTSDKIDIVELNEAFASQSLACIKDLNINDKKVNLDGGALALGHPLGATGARITGKAADLLKRENKKYALATQCIGLGMGIATIIESID